MIYMNKFLLLLIPLSFYGVTYAQKTDKRLNGKLLDAVQGFNGDIGIYVKNLRRVKIFSINADTVFPTASIVKVPILIGIMDKLNRKELDYNQELVYRDSLLYSDYDILGSFRDTVKIPKEGDHADAYN